MTVKNFWIYSKNVKTAGFTLLELLVALIIASLIISSLLYLVVDILLIDNREAARNETQQEMQMALNFITNELREAVYVYDGNCLKTGGQGNAGDANYCPGLLTYLPTFTNQTPILAFWKPEKIADNQMPDCTSVDTTKQQECNDLLVKRRTYTLVVYLQSTANSDNTWKGKSRITRYALHKYSDISSLTQSTGYVDPSQENSTTFQTWPVKPQDGTPLQTGSPLTTTDVLVDFVDDPNATGVTVPACDSTKVPSPKSTATTASSNSFFACISSVVPTTTTVITTPSGVNQDVVLYLRGNANGKSGVTNDNFRPVLQTQVLIRGVFNKIPN
jgi:prepilin-type N-terminal cleavage/methylation domain-containing protein